ncbi:unnamed protein product [Protopolystoma xenopodis]|uniref:Uncharacterized protein n=1 Tax=Protopolystoma xenopodis TaxID=117903 RepID=A0A448XJK8_9PLAT|nr:unnamed protein product [Protopolystoma xenopodis]
MPDHICYLAHLPAASVCPALSFRLLFTDYSSYQKHVHTLPLRPLSPPGRTPQPTGPDNPSAMLTTEPNAKATRASILLFFGPTPYGSIRILTHLRKHHINKHSAVSTCRLTNCKEELINFSPVPSSIGLSCSHGCKYAKSDTGKTHCMPAGYELKSGSRLFTRNGMREVRTHFDGAETARSQCGKPTVDQSGATEWPKSCKIGHQISRRVMEWKSRGTRPHGPPNIILFASHPSLYFMHPLPPSKCALRNATLATATVESSQVSKIRDIEASSSLSRYSVMASVP